MEPGQLNYFHLDELTKRRTSKIKLAGDEPAKVISLPTVTQPKQQRTEVGTDYQAVFQSGSTATMVVTSFQEYPKPLAVTGNLDYCGCFQGYWFSDSDVKMTCYVTEEEAKFWEAEEGDMFFTVEVMKYLDIATKINELPAPSHKVWATKPREYVITMDVEGQEVLQDEFNVTDKKCDVCGTTVNWDDIENSRFKFKNKGRYRLVCSSCVTKAKEKRAV
jgi:hypothetical protein